MPDKPLKSISLEKMEKIYMNDLGGEGPLVDEFLPADEVYNKDGSVKKLPEWADKFRALMDKALFKTERQSVSTLLTMCMLGEADENGQPKYDIEDVATVGRLTKEKQDIGKKLEQLMAIGPDGKQDEKKLMEMDKLFLIGIKRACNAMEIGMRKALEEGNFSELMTAKLSLVSNELIECLENIVQDGHVNSGTTGPLVPGAFLERISRKPENGGLSLEEQVLGKGQSYMKLADMYTDVSSVISNTTKLGNTVKAMLRGEPKNLISESLTQYVQFDRVLKRYRKNKNAPLKQMLGTIKQKDIKDAIREGRNVSLDNMLDHDYGQYVQTQVDEWVDEFEYNHKHDNIFIPFSAAAEDPLCRLGAAILAYNGILYRNINADLTFKKTVKGKGTAEEKIFVDEKLKSLSFEPITRRDLLRAVFRTDIPVKPFDAPHYIDLLERWENNLRNAVQKVTDLQPPLDAINTILAAADKLKNKLKQSTASVEDLDEVEKLISKFMETVKDADGNAAEPLIAVNKWTSTAKALQTQYKLKDGEVENLKKGIIAKDPDQRSSMEKELYDFYRRREMLDALNAGLTHYFDQIRGAVAFPKQMMEAGARIAPRPENEPLESEAARKDRSDWLRHLEQKMQDLQGRNMSKEWDSLWTALKNAQYAAAGMPDASLEMPSEEQIAYLDTRMQCLKDAATRYILHKLSTNDFDKGKDFERVKMAKIIESRVLRELEQTVPTMEKLILGKYTAMKDVHGEANEKPFLSRAAIKQTMDDIAPIIKKLSTSGAKSTHHSAAFSNMMTALNNLQFNQDKLYKNTTDELDETTDVHYYGVNGFIYQARNALEAYLQHKGDVNDGSLITAERMEAATQLHRYLDTLYNGAKRDKADRMAARQAAKEEAEKQELIKQEEEQKQLKKLEERANNEKYNEDLFKMRLDGAENYLKIFVSEHVIQIKNMGEKGDVVVTNSFKNKPDEYTSEMLSRAMLLLYVGELYKRAQTDILKENVMDVRANAVYHLIREGKLDQVLQETAENDPVAKPFTKVTPQILSAMSTENGRHQVERWVINHNAKKQAQLMRQKDYEIYIKALKEGLDSLKKEDPKERMSQPGGALKEVYARILFNYMKAKNYVHVTPDSEPEQFRKFADSKALQAAFMKHNVFTLRRLADNLSDARLEAEYKVITDNKYLNKISSQQAERALRFWHRSDSETNRNRFFDEFADERCTHIAAIQKDEKRLGLSGERYAYMALTVGEMLQNGRTLEEAFATFSFDTERRAAGRSVLKAYAEMDDERYAEFCANHLYTALKESLTYVNQKMTEMGEFSVQKFISPAFEGISKAMLVLQDVGQELERPAIKAAMKKMSQEKPDVYGDYAKLLDTQAGLATFLMLPQAHAQTVLDASVKYDIHTGMMPDNVKTGLIYSSILSLRHAEIMIRKAQQQMPADKNFLDMCREYGLTLGDRISRDNDHIMSANLQNADMTKPGVLSYMARSILDNKVPENADISISVRESIDATGIPVDISTIKLHKGMADTIKQATKLAKDEQQKMQKKEAGVVKK